jgi:divalent metal cation (Fe/Co/Zn/Cd) transporter
LEFVGLKVDEHTLPGELTAGNLRRLELARALAKLSAKHFPEIKDVRGIIISRVGDKVHVVLKCYFDPSLSMEQTHMISDKLEESIKSAYPDIDRIDIHEEPHLK